MTLNRKILTGFIICVIILAATAIFAFRNNQRFIETSQWVTHTHEVLEEFEQIQAGALAEESSVRGYVITGDEHFLEPFNAAKNMLVEHIDKVRRLTVDNPAQQKNIDLLKKELDINEKYLDDLTLLKKTNVKDAEELVSRGTGLQIQNEIKRLTAVCKDMEYTLLANRKAMSDEDAASFSIVFITLMVIIALILVTVFVMITVNLRALKKAEKESADRNWMLTGNQELNEKIRGERVESELAQSVINQLCHYLNAQVGLMYLRENGHLRLAAGYAHTLQKQNTNTIRIGDGLVGQAAAEKKLITFSEVPDGYLQISSGTGHMTPKHLAVLPLIQDNEVKGVIEIGTATRFSPLQLDFLNNISENIAIVVSVAQSRAQMKELLEETQRQAEELETQQEELKVANEELMEKTKQLEKSELTLKNQQEELQQTNEELEEKANLLEEQKEKLESAKMHIEAKARELEITSKYKSEFLANMSHELRTPLNSILILAQILQENKNGTLPAKEVEFAKNIHNSGSDLLNLINEILDLSKVEAGKLQLEIADVPVTQIKTDIAEMFSELAASKAIHFIIKSDERLPATIKTDKQRLEQIVKNLLSNAFKFTDRGGNVTVSIDRVNKKEIIFTNRKLLHAGDVMAFSVADTGIGIPADKLEIVFEAFQQLDGSSKRKYGGTGLGLSISRELASVLGGEIILKSEEGKGSTFTLYVPTQFDVSNMETTERSIEVKEKNEDAVYVNRKKAAPAFSGDDVADDRYDIGDNDKVLLIMEDDHTYATLLLAFARERQYKGIVIHDGSAGLSYARHYRPDAIILDMKLPGMDGAEVLRQLKSDPQLRHIPVQIVSGHDVKKEGMALGAFNFLQKPINKTDLQNSFNRIEDFLHKKLKKLLIVEDDDVQHNAIRDLIGNGDVKCFSAYSGKEAYEMMIKENADCVILDLGLPDMSGIDLLQKVKDNADLRDTPIIVYTAKDLTKEESNRLNKLANTVVLKTVDSKERLLDETTLFLHRVEAKLPKEKQNIIRKLHKTDEVLKNRTALIVDDDIRNIYSLTNALEDSGIICLVAENGREALEMLDQHPETEIVLMDVMMPEMDGYEATQEIRNNDKFAKLPIIALTAKAMKGDREKCLNAGMSDYISKPVNVEQLLSLMRVWLYR